MEGEPGGQILTSEHNDAGWISDGMTVSVGGLLNSSHPMPLICQFIRKGVRDLILVGAAAGLEVDLLVAAGCVKKLVAPMVSGESLAPIVPAFRRVHSIYPWAWGLHYNPEKEPQ